MNTLLSSVRVRCAPRRDQGAALVVTVLLMLVVSTLAFAAMMRNSIDERMAFNQRDRQNAFQAAEAALREAEDVIRQDARFSPLRVATFTADCTAAKGVCRSSLNTPQWKTLPASDWTSVQSNSTIALATNTQRGAIPGLALQPRYLIEYQGTSEPIEINAPCTAHFLITARGFGLNANSVVTLQSVFRWSIGACYDAL